ncbi:MAG TPA: carbonic anhydrase [Bacillota bacterium]|nr:carbonic anhydrase [Bacillota bacterium]
MIHEVTAKTPDRALYLLKLGNERRLAWLKRKAEDPEKGERFQENRRRLTEGQHPFAVVVSCSDSRVPPEIVFQNREGDIFVVRTAGHIIGKDAAGSIEYAVAHLHTPLVVVMGHDRCGAVTAAVKGETAPGHIFNVMENIYPVVEKVKNCGGDIVSAAITQHVLDTVAYLKKLEPICRKYYEEGKLNIIGARCPIDTYRVEWL